MSDILARLTASLADRYRIERELGAGGMATVYLAHDVRHDRKVALKVLRPELAAILGGERFLHEIRLTANLQHPHILPLHDSGEVDGTVFYVMPFVDGESLRDRLNREKQLPLEDALRVAREIADALAYAHEKGVVHRDIKPENILLHGGHAMVADFGIALAVSTVGGGTRMTETGMSLGTPHYMAPEQAMGDREITPRADIYALGCVTYEMLTGDPPFTGSTAQAIVARVVTESPRSMTSQRHTIPPHVEAVVFKALEKLPADRFNTAGEFAAALGNTSFSTARLSSVAGRQSSVSSRAARLALPMTGVAAAAIAFAAWAFTRPETPPAPVARFTVPLAGIASTGVFSPVLSPDGSRLLFVASDSARVSRVYLRHLDREIPVPVAGTEGTVNSAYFSHDSQWILFRQDGKLRKSAVAGGASLAICDLTGPLGGMSWSSRDVIVFTMGATLYRVSAAGGVPGILAAPDTAAGTLSYYSPHFLPDGRRLVAVRRTREGFELVTIDLETERVSSLGVAGLAPWFVASGHLLYVDNSGTLMAARFDGRRGRVTGPAEPLAEDVTMAQGSFARFSASRTGTVAFFSGGTADSRELVFVRRDGTVESAGVPQAAYRSPRFSPDGRRVAMGAVAEGRTLAGDVWVLERSSRRLTRLTYDTASTAPEWAPDGRRLIYPRQRAGGGAIELYQVAADASTEPAPFFSRPDNRIYESRLSRDGRHIVFREDGPPGTAAARDILIAPVDSPLAARPLAATSFNERALALTEDGRWLAFVSNLSGTPEVYIRRVEDGSPRWRVSTAVGLEPRWGPGGRELYFRRGDTVFVASTTLSPEPRIGQPRALFGGSFVASGSESQYDVSPDGRYFVMLRQSEGGERPSLHFILHHFDQPRRRAGE